MKQEKATYAIWRDFRTDTFEVIRWQGNCATTVQTNIPTRGKAMAAADTWRQREKEKSNEQRL
jgi:spore coat protein CotH